MGVLAHNSYEMKRQLNFGQTLALIAGILTPILIPLITFLSGLNQESTRHSEKIESIEKRQYDNQISTDKKLDRMETKQDQLSAKMEDVRILIENKQNRQ